jgi:hypothetical protein
MSRLCPMDSALYFLPFLVPIFGSVFSLITYPLDKSSYTLFQERGEASVCPDCKVYLSRVPINVAIIKPAIYEKFYPTAAV